MHPVVIWLGIVAVVAAIFICAGLHHAKVRREYIYRKYGRGPVAERVIAGKIWQGQTKDELLDSIGKPADTDEKVMKTKTKEIWKYHHRGGNRYGLRIVVENDVVVGWDEKL